MKPNLFNSSGIVFLVLCFSGIAYADFSLVCPPNVTVSCRVDYLHDLDVFGRAYTDFNGVIQYPHDCKTTIELDECGKGFIKRVWGVENPENWQWITCMQVITISNVDGFTYADITWPLSIHIRSCNPQADIKNLTAPYDAPHWNRQKCAKPMVSYNDTRFKVDEGCEKIIREWKVLDWCQYDPVFFPGRGIFTYTQVIKLITVSDSVALECKKDTIVMNNRHCDSIYVQLDSAIFHSSCQIYHKIYNTSKFAIHSGANASGYYPNGITKFYYIAEYACGTEVKCEVTVNVINKLQPTPYCLTGVILTLMPADTDNDGLIDDGMITIWASDLDKGSWHKCPGQRLNFSFSKDILDRSRVYTCKDVGTNQVEIWVTDSLGNQDFCITQIEVQNNNPNIPDCDGNLHGGTKSIRGHVMFPGITPPSFLNVKLESSLHQKQIQLDKNNKFEFHFADLNSGEDYLLSSECQSIDREYLNYDDLSCLKKLIDGKYKPLSAYQLIAADINQDHQLNMNDYLILKQIVYFKAFHLLNYKWVFLPESFTFQNPNEPYRELMPTGIHINKLDHDMDQQNLVAIRIGDLVTAQTKQGNFEIRSNDEAYSENIECIVKSINPGQSELEFYFNIENTQNCNFRIFNAEGKLMLNENVMFGEGIQAHKLNVHHTGLAFYQLQINGIQFTGKVFLR